MLISSFIKDTAKHSFWLGGKLVFEDLGEGFGADKGCPLRIPGLFSSTRKRPSADHDPDLMMPGFACRQNLEFFWAWVKIFYTFEKNQNQTAMKHNFWALSRIKTIKDKYISQIWMDSVQTDGVLSSYQQVKLANKYNKK